MPAPSNPPFEAGAQMQPRQLNRWLDVNKINKLTRASTYFTIPSFDVDVTWLGYSELVAVFNYTSANNFSIKPIASLLPISPNYLACVMWADSSHNVYRYKLWEDVGEILFFDVPIYTEQRIKKHFRIEIWNTNAAACSQATDIDIYTSVLQSYDYRYADDALVAPTPTIFENLSNVLPLVLPAVFPTNSSPTLN